MVNFSYAKRADISKVFTSANLINWGFRILSSTIDLNDRYVYNLVTKIRSTISNLNATAGKLMTNSIWTWNEILFFGGFTSYGNTNFIDPALKYTLLTNSFTKIMTSTIKPYPYLNILWFG